MPTKPTTLHDYSRRVARAMAHIAANLDRAPALEELAAVAAFSPFHFHRVYGRWRARRRPRRSPAAASPAPRRNC